MGPPYTFTVTNTRNYSGYWIRFAVSSSLSWVLGINTKKIRMPHQQVEKIRELANLLAPTECQFSVVSKKQINKADIDEDEAKVFNQTLSETWWTDRSCYQSPSIVGPLTNSLYLLQFGRPQKTRTRRKYKDDNKSVPSMWGTLLFKILIKMKKDYEGRILTLSSQGSKTNAHMWVKWPRVGEKKSF